LPTINDEKEELPNLSNEITNWRSVLQKFSYQSTEMSSEEYLELDSCEITSDILTKKEIIELTTAEPLPLENEEKNDPEVVNGDLVEPQVINSTEALSYVDLLETFFAQSQFSPNSSLDYVNKLRKDIEHLKEKKLKQPLIRRFLF
jgi:hypothetical protein